MSFFGVSGLLTLVTSLPLGLFFLFKTQRTAIHKTWGLFAVAVAIWGVGVFFISRTQDSEKALLFWRLTHFGVILIPVLFFDFIQKFLNTRVSLSRYIVFSLGALFLIANTIDIVFGTSLFIANVRYVFNQFYYDSPPTLLYTFFTIFFFANVIYTHIQLFIRYIHSEGVFRKQIEYFFLATAVGFSGGSTSFLPVFGIDFYPYLNLTVPIYPVIMSAGILQYHLFDIKVVITEFASILVVLAITAELFNSKTPPEFLLRSVLLVFVAYGAWLLNRSILLEIKRREQIAQLAQQLKIANEHLQELDRMKTEFVSLASHELLTPISAIEGYLSMMLDEKIVDPKSEKGVEYLHRVYGSAKRLAKLVTNLLNVSRIEEGRLLVQNKALDINKVIDTVVGELKFKAKEKNLGLVWQPAEWPLVYADEEKLKEVLVNLIGNAIKYSDQGEISVAVEVVPTVQIQMIDQKQQEYLKQPGQDEALSHHIEAARRKLIGDRQLVVNVRDTGIGIAAEEVNNLFKKFYRIGEVTTRRTQGTGLGLYISKSLVEMMHGRMWAKSQGKGKGSTFSFSLVLDVYEPQIKIVERDIKVPSGAKPLAHTAAGLT